MAVAIYLKGNMFLFVPYSQKNKSKENLKKKRIICAIKCTTFKQEEPTTYTHTRVGSMCGRET